MPGGFIGQVGLGLPGNVMNGVANAGSGSYWQAPGAMNNPWLIGESGGFGRGHLAPLLDTPERDVTGNPSGGTAPGTPGGNPGTPGTPGSIPRQYLSGMYASLFRNMFVNPSQKSPWTGYRYF